MPKLFKMATVLFLGFLCQNVSFVAGQNQQRWPLSWGNPQTCVYAQTSSGQDDSVDLEWFKNELRISPKYQERDVGILGLSWAHFLIMVFLTISFVAALVAVIIRYRKTKELLTLLLEEEKKE